MQAETVAHPMQEAANDLFGIGVFAANAAHVPATPLFREPVYAPKPAAAFCG